MITKRVLNPQELGLVKLPEIIGYVCYDSNYIPIILCKSRKDFPEGFTFKCSFCKKSHSHGMNEGHRIAHCHNDKSPYAKTGYIVTKDKNYFKRQGLE